MNENKLKMGLENHGATHFHMTACILFGRHQDEPGVGNSASVLVVITLIVAATVDILKNGSGSDELGRTVGRGEG